MAHGVGQRLLKDTEGGGRERRVELRRDPVRDFHLESRPGGDAPGLVLDGAAEVAMVERRRPQVAGDPPDHRDADVDLADGRLQLVRDVARDLQLLHSAHGGREIELDTGQELPQLIMKLTYLFQG